MSNISEEDILGWLVWVFIFSVLVSKAGYTGAKQYSLWMLICFPLFEIHKYSILINMSALLFFLFDKWPANKYAIELKTKVDQLVDSTIKLSTHIETMCAEVTKSENKNQELVGTVRRLNHQLRQANAVIKKLREERERPKS